MDIDIAALPSMPLSDRKRFPEVACVYFVMDADGVLQYIGRTGRLRRRWLSHHREEGAARVAWLETEAAEDQIEMEQALIERFHPPKNGKSYIPGKIAALDQTVSLNLNLSVSPAVYDRLKHMAAADYRSLSNLARRLIETATGKSLTDILQDAAAPPPDQAAPR